MRRVMKQISTFSFIHLFKSAFDAFEEREAQKRDYLYASELGKANYDVIQKMRGIAPSTPPNKRSRAKFLAGNLYEFVVKCALIQLGLYQTTQERIGFERNGYLRVSGKLDFVIGGKPDFTNLEKSLQAFDELGFDDSMKKLLFYFGTVFKEWYENEYVPENGEIEIPKMILELKTSSVFMMNVRESENKADDGHAFQLYHYIYNHPTVRFGKVLYVCKDDVRMLEFAYSAADTEMEKKYLAEVKRKTDLYNEFKDVSTENSDLCTDIRKEISILLEKQNELRKEKSLNPFDDYDAEIEAIDKQLDMLEISLKAAKNEAFKFNPSLEPLVIIDEFTGKLKKSWKVEYSDYLEDYFYNTELTTVYFTMPKEYDDWCKDLGKINTVLKRKFSGAKMTKNNEEKIQLLKEKYGFDFEEVFVFFEQRQKFLIRQGMFIDLEDEE